MFNLLTVGLSVTAFSQNVNLGIIPQPNHIEFKGK